MFFCDRNEIGELEEDTIASFKNTVSTLFLGENDLGDIPPRFFRFQFTNHMTKKLDRFMSGNNIIWIYKTVKLFCTPAIRSGEIVFLVLSNVCSGWIWTTITCVTFLSRHSHLPSWRWASPIITSQNFPSTWPTVFPHSPGLHWEEITSKLFQVSFLFFNDFTHIHNLQIFILMQCFSTTDSSGMMIQWN